MTTMNLHSPGPPRLPSRPRRLRLLADALRWRVSGALSRLARRRLLRLLRQRTHTRCDVVER